MPTLKKSTTPEVKDEATQPTEGTPATPAPASPKKSLSPTEIINEAYAREDEYMEGLDVTALAGYANYQYALGLPAGGKYEKQDLLDRIKNRRSSGKKAAPSAKHFQNGLPVGYAKVTLNNPGDGKSKHGEYFNLNDVYLYWIPWDREVVLPIPLVDYIASLTEVKMEMGTPENNFRTQYREVRAYPINVLERNPDPQFEDKQQAALEAGLEKSRQRRKESENRRALARQLMGRNAPTPSDPKPGSEHPHRYWAFSINTPGE